MSGGRVFQGWAVALQSWVQMLFMLCCTQLVFWWFQDSCHSSSHHIVDNCLEHPKTFPTPNPQASLLITEENST